LNIVSRKFDKKETGTVFRHTGNGKIITRLDARLSAEDWEQLQVLISMVYRQGMIDGSEERATEIRAALGLVAG
jgi:hypothetical protein